MLLHRQVGTVFLGRHIYVANLLIERAVTCRLSRLAHPILSFFFFFGRAQCRNYNDNDKDCIKKDNDNSQ